MVSSSLHFKNPICLITLPTDCESVQFRDARGRGERQLRQLIKKGDIAAGRNHSPHQDDTRLFPPIHEDAVIQFCSFAAR
jgi:hypothetical protein